MMRQMNNGTRWPSCGQTARKKSRAHHAIIKRSLMPVLLLSSMLLALTWGAPSVSASSDWSFEFLSYNVHDVRVIDLPDDWPFLHDGADIELPVAQISIVVPEEFAHIIAPIESTAVSSPFSTVAMDFYPMFCLREFKFDTVLHNAQPEFCCNDTAISVTLSNMFTSQEKNECSYGRCRAFTPIFRAITKACSAALLAAGFEVALEKPYQIHTFITIEGFGTLHPQHQSSSTSAMIPIFPSVILDSQKGRIGDFVVFKRSSSAHRKHSNAHPSSASDHRVSASPTHEFHRLADRLTSQELFYLDRLFSVTSVSPCPTGTRLQTVGHAHSACTPSVASSSPGARNIVLWFGSDYPPVSSGIEVFVFDCTLASPAFTHSNFFPWCISDIPEDMFLPSPSLSHIYTSFTTSAINATSTTAPICRLQGRAALSTITSVLSRQCVAHNQESDLSAPSIVHLLRIHVHKDSLPCFQKVALPQNSTFYLCFFQRCFLIAPFPDFRSFRSWRPRHLHCVSNYCHCFDCNTLLHTEFLVRNCFQMSGRLLRARAVPILLLAGPAHIHFYREGACNRSCCRTHQVGIIAL
jgi:hypothetical protein